SPASALTMAECSTKYNAAKDAGSLNGQTWNQFRKAECAADASPAAAAEPAKKATTKAATEADAPKGLTTKECSTKYQAAKDAGTLNGMKWNDFRKAECAAGAVTEAAAPAKATKKTSDTAAADAPKGLTTKECSVKYQAAK